MSVSQACKRWLDLAPGFEVALGFAFGISRGVSFFEDTFVWIAQREAILRHRLA